MPLFKIDIEKFLRGEYWTNRYILDAASITEAADAAGGFMQAERLITIPDVEFTKIRTSDGILNNDQFIIEQVNLPGTRVVNTQALPLFDVLRVDFSVGIGRPSRKYLRGVLAEGDQENYGDLLQASIDFFNLNYAGPVAAFPEYVDVDGQPIVSGAAHGQVGMRQLRRGSKRKLEPII